MPGWQGVCLNAMFTHSLLIVVVFWLLQLWRPVVRTVYQLWESDWPWHLKGSVRFTWHPKLIWYYPWPIVVYPSLAVLSWGWMFKPLAVGSAVCWCNSCRIHCDKIKYATFRQMVKPFVHLKPLVLFTLLVAQWTRGLISACSWAVMASANHLVLFGFNSRCKLWGWQ